MKTPIDAIFIRANELRNVGALLEFYGSFLEGDARKMRLPRIVLGGYKANETARALYEKRGFQIVRELSQQNQNDSYEMEMDLQAACCSPNGQRREYRP